MQIIHTAGLQNSESNTAQFSDRELFKKCQQYGANARMWAKKFAALLPEVEKRQLYKKHGFYSIFEFAAKLAGMGRETVLEVLRVAQKLQDKPILLAQLEIQGWSKMKVIANVATKENEKIWADKISKMSKATLETFVKELRKQNNPLVQNRPGAELHERSECAISTMQQTVFSESTGPKDETQNLDSEKEPNNTPHYRISVRMPLKPATELRLRQLQKKLSQAAGAPVDFNHVMETLLDSYEINSKKRKSQKIELGAAKNREQKSNKIASPSPTSSRRSGAGLKVTAEEKSMLLQSKKTPQQMEPDAEQNSAAALGSAHGDATSALNELEHKAREKIQELEERAPYESKPKRQIPVIIKKFVLSKSSDRCAYPNCQKLPEIFHHTKRFSLVSDHNPEFLAPLCKEHERLAHHGLIENETGPAKDWRVQTITDTNAAKFEVDRKVVEKRKIAR